MRPPTTAAASDLSGTRHVGAKRPASPAAASAPSTIPKFITDVTSSKTLACSSAVRAGVCQYGQLDTSTPVAATSFDPQSANADVTPHGLPAITSVATLIAASPSAPATSGQGPRRSDADAVLRSRSPWRRRSIATDAIATDPKSSRLPPIAGASPSDARSVVGAKEGVVSHSGMCTTPTTEPAMNAARVTSILTLPPPALYSVPDAHPPPS